MFPTILKIGPLVLSTYGFMLAVAFMVGIFLAKQRGLREGIDSTKIEALSFRVVVAGVLGARFLYTFVEHASYYFRHPVEFFYFQKGGLSFMGGLFLAIFVSLLYCKKHQLSFWQIADIFTPSIALGLSFAKVGCFLAGCCHGKVCDLPWGVIFNHTDTLADPKNIPLHPAQLYESFATLMIFFGLLILQKFRSFQGQIFLIFVIVYGVVRSVLEVFRGQPGKLGFLTTAQSLSIPMIVLATLLLIQKFKSRQT